MLDLIYELVGLDESEGPRELFDAARLVQGSLPFLILSLLEQEGATFGPASRDELQRARIREAYLTRLAGELAGPLNLSVMKGPAIAEWYPPGVLRAFTDLDLVAPDEDALWRTVKRIVESEPVDRIDVSLIGGAPRHLVVTMAWPSTDPLIDPGYSADVSTAAFNGDNAVVPVRATLPDDRAVAALLSVAEERFQRSFLPRDVIDVAMLDAAPLPPLSAVLATIDEYCRGPEVAELLRYAGGYLELGPLGEVLAALKPVVERESARREAAGPVTPSDNVEQRLATGQVVYGYPVRPVAWQDLPRATVETFSHGHLLRTPIGDYLLTGGDTVSRAEYEAALVHCGVAGEGRP